MAWTDLASAADLEKAGKLVVRHEGRQILLLETPAGRFACLNRCPHEGYPLREGTVVADSENCVLTCQWHNWKFDLASGATLVGGDRLVRFPIRRVGARIQLDIVPEDPAERRRRHLAGLTGALLEADQQRLLRETARLLGIGCDFRDVLRHGIAWAQDRLEFGTTHAIAAAPDWLGLAGDHRDDRETLLIALGEILGHLSDDARDRSLYPIAEGIDAWDDTAFLAALEAQDEPRAIRLMRGGLAAGIADGAWRRLFARAALAHYADFGHSLIYCQKTMDLIRDIGADVAGPLLAMLVRSHCFATREDLIPEFRAYHESRTRWGLGETAPAPLAAHHLRGASPRQALRLVTGWSVEHAPEAIFSCLLEAAAWQLLHVDEAQFRAVDVRLADNVGWLDFTHAFTFAEAGLLAVWEDSTLWPDLLLQLACFVGRNAAFVDADFDAESFSVPDPDAFWQGQRDALLDHGRGRFIISAHLVKTLTAAAQLAASHHNLAPLLAAALKRFLKAEIKERHLRRTARQMLALVAEE